MSKLFIRLFTFLTEYVIIEKNYWKVCEMKIRIRVGDTVKVIRTGHQYTTYIQMAIELGADVSSYILEQFKTDPSFRRFDHARAEVDRKCKWIYGYESNKGDVCKVLNMASMTHILIERIYDGRQFLFSHLGLKVIEKKQMFNDKDFLL